MESVVIERSPSCAGARFGSVDHKGLLIPTRSLINTTCSSSFLVPKNQTFKAKNYAYTYSSLAHQPPLLPLPGSTGTRSAFPQRARHKRPVYGEARDDVAIDKLKEKEAALSSSLSSSSSFVCSVSSPPPSSVPMPRFVITKGKAAEGKNGGGGSGSGSSSSGVDVCATDGLRRLLRI